MRGKEVYDQAEKTQDRQISINAIYLRTSISQGYKRHNQNKTQIKNKEEDNIMKLKKVLTIALSSILVLAAIPFSAFADNDNLANGKYEADVEMYKQTEDSLSMSDALFAGKVDITVKDGQASIITYVAYPVPSFPTLGTNGTITDFKVKHKGQTYNGTLDITSKPLKSMKADSPAFGIVQSQPIPTEVITVKAPVSVLEEEFINTEAYVAVVMNTNVKFRMKLSNLTLVEAEGNNSGNSGTTPSTTDSKEVTIKASIAASQATYSVVIPESISFGELNRNQDNQKNYDVSVTMGTGTTGVVKVSAAAAGELVLGDDKIPFTNDFGSKEFTATKTETGTLTVLGKDLKNKKPGDYRGTTSFNIEYRTQ